MTDQDARDLIARLYDMARKFAGGDYCADMKADARANDPYLIRDCRWEAQDIAKAIRSLSPPSPSTIEGETVPLCPFSQTECDCLALPKDMQCL